VSVSINTIKVVLLGLRNTDNAVLELFLRKHCTNVCRIVSDEQADLCILDLDGIQGKQLLQQQRNNHPHRPLIALSVRDTDIDGVQFLRKPLRSALLKKAIEFYAVEKEKQAHTQQPNPEPQAPTVAEAQQKQQSISRNTQHRPVIGFAGNQARSSLGSLQASRRTEQECFGLPHTIELNKPMDRDKLFYDPTELFQNVLKHAIEQCRHAGRPICLHLPGEKSITLLPKANVALTELSDARLRPRCLFQVKQDDIHIEHLDSNESQLLLASNHLPQNIDALLWKVALWSARGRLPVGTDINAQVGLQHWPNVTRLLTIPQFLRVAALWAKRPQSLATTVDMLSIEARYVCAFFSACQVLGLTWMQTVSATPESEFANVNATTPAPARAGLLRRILRHLHVA
jgi:hypothetical protein